MCFQRKMGIYLSSPKTDKLLEDGENDKLKFGLASMQGWRASMEDAHAAYPNLDASTAFFGVYDGHGGDEVAKFCAKYLHQQFLRHEAYSAGELSTSIQKSFLRMDELMRSIGSRKELASLTDSDKVKDVVEGLWSPRSSENKGKTTDWPSKEEGLSDYNGPTSGCTACVAIIQNNQLLVANAGDSRCVLSRKGQAHDLSRDHKPDLEVEKDRILKAGGYIQCGRVNGSLNLARAIGDMELKQNKTLPAERQIVTANPDIKTVELCADDDFLVLACDGIWDCMSSQQLVDFVKDNLNNASPWCLAPSSGGEGCDNMTMILVQFKKNLERDAPTTTKEQPTPSNKQSESSRGAAGESGSN
nr:probable protein phosphatase 2C 60 [Ipomoea batatas]